MSTAVNANHPEVAKARQAGIAPAIWIVACGKAKQATTTTARDLYTGDLTRKQIAFAASRGTAFGGESPVLIASARYGLVDLDTPVAPYDVTLADFDESQLVMWVELVAAQAAERGIDAAQVHLLAGGRYEVALRAAFDRVAAVWTGGYRARAAFMGERKAALTRLLAA